MVPSIRRATLEDVAALVELRLAFLQEGEPIEDEAEWQEHKQAVRRYFTERLATGELHTWVAEIEGRASDQQDREGENPAFASGPSRREGQIVATGVLILEPKPPSQKNLSGLEAFVFNMYTIPAWRGKGFATQILEEMVDFAKKSGAGRVWLYASERGEPVYARAGFVIKRRQRPEMELAW